jgi:hypothetical protein
MHSTSRCSYIKAAYHTYNNREQSETKVSDQKWDNQVDYEIHGNLQEYVKWWIKHAIYGVGKRSTK